MPAAIRAVPGTNTIYATMQASLPRWFTDDCNLWTIRWSNHSMRGSKTGRQARRAWTFAKGYWPYGGRMSFVNDPAAPTGNVSKHMDFEPWHAGPGGSPGIKFIMGKCKDASGVAIGGAVVQGFRTTNDQFVRETQADDQGNYELGTEYPNEGHYLVAYSAGSPDRTGATVNTLVGTNRDGS